MGQFYSLSSIHGSVLASRQDGEIINIMSRLKRPELLPLFAYVCSPASTTCFLLADLPPDRSLSLHPQKAFGPIVPLRMTRIGKDGQVSLFSPESGAFLTIAPVDEEIGQGNLALAAIEIKEWEHVYLHPAQDELPIALYHLAALVDVLGVPDPSPASMHEQILRGDTSPTAAAVMNAAGLLLLPGQLQALALSLLADSDAAVSSLKAIFKDDVYAQHALPSVLHWIGSQNGNVWPRASQPYARFVARLGNLFRKSPRDLKLGTASTRPAELPNEPSPTSKNRVVSEHFDFLAQENVFLRYDSMPAALNRKFRVMVRPTRRICILATARNEGLYILEWVAYHRAAGFDHIFLYSNDNTDGSDDLLRALSECNAITWISNVVGEGVAAQPKAYGHALRIMAELLDFAWTLAIDLDEFFIPSSQFADIHHFLNWHETRPVDAIAVNWRIFGSNGQTHWRDDLLWKRFPRAWPVVDAHVKTIFRTSRFVHSFPHDPTPPYGESFLFRNASGDIHQYDSLGSRGVSLNPVGREAVIGHFFFKSNEEMIWKSARNRGDDPRRASLGMSGLHEGFIRQLVGSRGKDTEALSISDYTGRTKVEIARLLEQPNVTNAFQGIKANFRHQMPGLVAAARSHPAMLAAAEDGIAFMMPFADERRAAIGHGLARDNPC